MTQKNHKMAYSASGVTPAKKDKRNRIQFRFWLDANKALEASMGHELDIMRKDKTKNFAAFMRNAIRLMLSLMAGQIAVLLDLFPGIVEAIRQDARAELQAENAALRAQLEQLQQTPQSAGDGLEEIVRRAIADEMTKHREPVSVEAPQSPKIGANQGGLKPIGNSGGLKPIGGLNRIAPPVLDDTDDIELTVNKAKFDGNATQNFLNSMKTLQTKGKK